MIARRLVLCAVLALGCDGWKHNRCTEGELSYAECHQICEDNAFEPAWCARFGGSTDGGADGGADGAADGDAGADGGCGCMDGGVCADGACVECVTSDDCAVGEQCSAEQACVDCVDNDGCSGATPVCDSASATCVECVASAQCAGASASRCDTTSHACTGCTEDADCTRLVATPVCDEAAGVCRACTRDTAADYCGDDVCRVSDGTCVTGLLRASKDPCLLCTYDTECEPGQVCATHTFGATVFGPFCFFEAGTVGCASDDATKRPYRLRADGVTTVEGFTANVCLPAESTTCAGIADFRAEQACATDADCGETDLTDGYCPPSGPRANRCTYLCGVDAECDLPAGTFSCGGSEKHCR